VRTGLSDLTERLQCYAGPWSKVNGAVVCGETKVLVGLKQPHFEFKEVVDFFGHLGTALNKVPDILKPTQLYSQPRFEVQWVIYAPGRFSDDRTTGPALIIHNDMDIYEPTSVLCYIANEQMGYFVCDYLNSIFGEWSIQRKTVVVRSTDHE